MGKIKVNVPPPVAQSHNIAAAIALGIINGSVKEQSGTNLLSH